MNRPPEMKFDAYATKRQVEKCIDLLWKAFGTMGGKAGYALEYGRHMDKDLKALEQILFHLRDNLT